MTATELLQLVNAGFTKEEIFHLTTGNNPGPDPGPDPVPDPVPDPIPDPIPDPSPDPVPGPDPDPGSNQDFDQLRQEMTQTRSDISAMMKELQKLNLKTNTVNVTPADDVSTRAAQALAEIIRPTFKKEA